MSKNRGIVSERMKHTRTEAAAMEFGQMQALFAPYLEIPEEFGATQRKSIYTHARVFWLFLLQVLAADGGCVAAVQSFLAWFKSTTGKEVSPNTGAYCTARNALPLEDVKGLHAPLVESLDKPDGQFWNRSVLVVDGSSVSMPDTEQNQTVWPQPKSQKSGCGFPIMRILGVFSLGTGIWRALVFSALAVSERTLFHNAWDQFTAGDIVLADTGFCSYADYVLLERRGVDCVMLNHQCRKRVRAIKKLGKNDRLVEWSKTNVRPKWLTQKQWEELPDTLIVREITVHVDVPGFRSQTLVIVTTLRDPKAYRAEDIAALYRRRWAIELYFRDIKISMGADVLRCKTPERIEKELWMHVIAYNLVRALICKAAREHGVSLEKISFKGACDAVRNWVPVIAQARGEHRTSLLSAMLKAIARNLVPDRPNRTEPRAKKRRPKNYQLLTKPRHIFKESPHRGKKRPCAA
jgi:hypothetical protein